MFFNNLLVYRLTQAIPFDRDPLEDALRSKPAREPASQELSTYGFTAPFGKGENAPLVYMANGFILVCARKVEKIIPSGAIAEAVKEKVERIESEQCRKVYKKERDQIKDEIIQEALPRAFKRSKVTYAAIDPERGLIYVNAASRSVAEDLLSTLRECIGSLPVRPVTVKIAPSATLTDWIKHEQPAPEFYVLDYAALSDTQEGGGTATLKNQDLTGEEAKLHIASGKVATKVSLAWQDKLSFMMDDSLAVKRLKFEDLLHDQAESDGGEDAAGQFDASFCIMMGTLREFLPELLAAFGGEEIPQGLGEDPVPAAKPLRQVRDEVQVDAFDGEQDAMYPDAVSFVRSDGRASVSAVQRKFKIGYNRAARLVERMEADGVVTPMNSNGSREVVAQ